MDNSEDLTICPICKDIAEDPRWVGNCTHIVCFKCLKDMKSLANQRNIKLFCPVSTCQRELEVKDVNLLPTCALGLVPLGETFNEPQRSCDECDDVAVCHCSEESCGYLCEVHAFAHQRSKLKKNHQTQKLVSHEWLPSSYCAKHQLETIKRFCLQDNIILCDRCWPDHQHHPIKLLHESCFAVVQNDTATIQAIRIHLKETEQILQKGRRSIDQLMASRDSAFHTIDNTIQPIIDKLKQLQTVLKNKVQEEVASHKAQLSSQIDTLTTTHKQPLSHLSQLFGKAESVANNFNSSATDCRALLECYPALSASTKKILKELPSALPLPQPQILIETDPILQKIKWSTICSIKVDDPWKREQEERLKQEKKAREEQEKRDQMARQGKQQCVHCREYVRASLFGGFFRDQSLVCDQNPNKSGHMYKGKRYCGQYVPRENPNPHLQAAQQYARCERCGLNCNDGSKWCTATHQFEDHF